MTTDQALPTTTDTLPASDLPPPPASFTLPDEEDQAGWSQLYKTLGQPETPDGYSFPESKAAPDAMLQSWFKDSAYQAGLSVRQASALAGAWEQYIAQAQQAELASKKEASDQDVYLLRKEWGPAFDERVVQARRAATHYGMSLTEIDALETVLGTKKMLTFCFRLGQDIAEPKLVTAPKGGSHTSPGSAKEKLHSLTKDTQFMTNYLNGDKASLAQMQQVMKEAYGTL